MKKILTFSLLAFLAFSLQAQDDKSPWPDMDKSTYDATTYPTKAQWRNYMTGDDRTIQAKMRVEYSRPKKNDREIFGALVPYNKEWRLGANQATILRLFVPAEIGGVALNSGTYSLFATPGQSEWTIHVSTQTGIWGGENRDMDKNVAMVKVPVSKPDETLESLSMTFQEVDEMHANLVIGWDDTQVKMPIAFNPVFYRPEDASPMDVAMFPAKAAYTNYLEGEEKNLTPKVKVVYSRPFKKDRDVFGGLLKYGDVWRVGANESTEITFYQNVNVAGTDVRRGRYALYAVVNQNSWDLILSTDLPAWGSANRDESKDVAKINVASTTDAEVLENLSIYFEEKSADLAHMHIGWDKTRVAVPITIPSAKSSD